MQTKKREILQLVKKIEPLKATHLKKIKGGEGGIVIDDLDGFDRN